jgi:hypothetical protein
VSGPRGPDFLGLGAQKAGTSWISSCLYDHPQVCIPIKDLHFFSRERNWVRGITWYEEQFARCGPKSMAGEFSTSYLADPVAPGRIHEHYPRVRMITCLRNPAERAFSNFLNDLQAGTLPPRASFEEAVESHPEYTQQGAYASQLRRYLDLFPRESMLIVLYDDLQRDPLPFMSSIYRFLEVDDAFVPRMLHERVNVARVPRSTTADRLARKAVTSLRRRGLGRVVWLAKRSGLPRLSYRMNSRPAVLAAHELTPERRQRLTASFAQEIDQLEQLLGRDLGAWRC